MKELPLYNGEAPQAPQVQVQKPGAIPALPMWGQNVSAAINAVGDALIQYGELEDYGTAAEIGRKRKELAERANRDFTEKARLPWGAEGSFYNEDGTRNEDEIRAFAAKWEEENEKLGTGRFWLRKNALRAAEEKEDFSVGFALEVDKNILRGEQENRETLFRDNYDLCVAKEDYAGAAEEVDKAVAGGMITKARAKGGGKGKGTVRVKDLTDAMLGSLLEAEREEAAAEPDKKAAGDAKPMEMVQDEEGKLELQESDGGDSLTRLEVGGAEAAPDLRVGSEAAEARGDSLEDFLKPTEEDLRLGRDPWDKPEVLRAGYAAMTPDEVGEQWLNLGTRAAQVRAVAAEEGMGRMRLEIPEAAEEPMAVVAHAANVRGGMTLEDYKKGAYATMCAVMTNPDFDGLSDEDMKKLMVGRVQIEGLEEQFFADLAEEDRAVAMESLVNGIAERVLSTRGDNIRKRVDEFFAGAEGLPGATAVVKGLDDASIGGMYEPTEAEKALMSYSWWDWMNDSESKKGFQLATGKLWAEYRDRYAAETGEEIEGKLTDNNVRKFRDWYAETILPEKVQAYVEEAKWVCTQAGIDAVVEYRRNGGESWAEENEKMMDAISKARKNLKGGGELAEWREKRDAEVAARAAMHREDAAEYAPMLEAARKESEEAKEAKAAKAAAEKERKAYEEGKRKAAQRKVWDAELEAQERRAAPYRYPVVKRISYAAGGGDEAVVTLPEAEYMKVVQDLKVGRGEGVVCTFGNGKKQLAVRPGKGKKTTYNLPAIQLLYNNKRLKKEEIKKLVNPHLREMRFKKVISNVIK